MLLRKRWMCCFRGFTMILAIVNLLFVRVNNFLKSYIFQKYFDLFKIFFCVSFDNLCQYLDQKILIKLYLNYPISLKFYLSTFILKFFLFLKIMFLFFSNLASELFYLLVILLDLVNLIKQNKVNHRSNFVDHSFTNLNLWNRDFLRISYFYGLFQYFLGISDSQFLIHQNNVVIFFILDLNFYHPFLNRQTLDLH